MRCVKNGLRLLCPCCLALCGVGCSKSTMHWIEQAKSDDPAQRLRAIHELQGRTSEPDAVVPALIDALQDKNNYVRRDAARALAAFGENAKGAVPALTARLRDDEPSVRKAAAQSLREIDPAAEKLKTK